jgi:hypothetical protein
VSSQNRQLAVPASVLFVKAVSISASLAPITSPGGPSAVCVKRTFFGGTAPVEELFPKASGHDVFAMIAALPLIRSTEPTL